MKLHATGLRFFFKIFFSDIILGGGGGQFGGHQSGNMGSNAGKTLSFIPFNMKTPKQILTQTVEAQMKYRSGISSGSLLFARDGTEVYIYLEIQTCDHLGLLYHTR